MRARRPSTKKIGNSANMLKGDRAGEFAIDLQGGKRLDLKRQMTLSL